MDSADSLREFHVLLAPLPESFSCPLLVVVELREPFRRVRVPLRGTDVCQPPTLTIDEPEHLVEGFARGRSRNLLKRPAHAQMRRVLRSCPYLIPLVIELHVHLRGAGLTLEVLLQPRQPCTVRALSLGVG